MNLLIITLLATELPIHDFTITVNKKPAAFINVISKVIISQVFVSIVMVSFS